MKPSVFLRAGYICWFKSLFYTLLAYLRTGEPTPIAGHEYVEQDDGSLKCSVCGEVSK